MKVLIEFDIKQIYNLKEEIEAIMRDLEYWHEDNFPDLKDLYQELLKYVDHYELVKKVCSQ